MIKSTHPKVLMVVESSTKPYYLGLHLWLGPLYILSYLEKRGIDGDFFDRNAEPLRYVDYLSYDVVCFSANVNNIKRSLATAREIKHKKPYIKVVFGGPFANAYSKLLSEEGFIDAIIKGEGEETFYEYVTAVNKNNIKGLYYRENGGMRFTGERPYIDDLDSLPFPALHKAKIKKYNSIFTKRLPFSYIVTTRGCPYPCTFCFHNMGKKWRARSPKNVVDEIEWQVSSLGVREIGITDDNFTLDRKRVIEVCDEIVKRKIDVKLQFSNGVRADFVDDEMMAKLKAAGFWVINFAPESGSEETIKRLKKGFKEGVFENAVRIAKKHGLATELFLIIGMPWETKEDYEKTLMVPYELDVDFVSISRYIPFPGTALQPNELSQEDKEKLLSDRLYNGEAYNKKDEVAKIIRAFYRKWYGDPRRLMRTVKILNILSTDKLFNFALIRDVLPKIWMRYN